MEIFLSRANYGKLEEKHVAQFLDSESPISIGNNRKMPWANRLIKERISQPYGSHKAPPSGKSASRNLNATTSTPLIETESDFYVDEFRRLKKQRPTTSKTNVGKYTLPRHKNGSSDSRDRSVILPKRVPE